MTNEKPPCPQCDSNAKVKTRGGGSKGLYRYICEDPSCRCTWQEIAPHKLLPGEERKIIKKPLGGNRDNGYKCGKCGLRKLGHVCTKVMSFQMNVDLDTLSIVAVGESSVSVETEIADDMPPLALFEQPLPFSSLSSRVGMSDRVL